MDTLKTIINYTKRHSWYCSEKCELIAHPSLQQQPPRANRIADGTISTVSCLPKIIIKPSHQNSKNYAGRNLHIWHKVQNQPLNCRHPPVTALYTRKSALNSNLYGFCLKSLIQFAFGETTSSPSIRERKWGPEQNRIIWNSETDSDRFHFSISAKLPYGTVPDPIRSLLPVGSSGGWSGTGTRGTVSSYNHSNIIIHRMRLV